MSKFSRLLSQLKTSEITIYRVIQCTIKEFIDNWLPIIDCEPVHQRINTENNGLENPKKKYPSKRQGIIGSILKGIDVSEIKLNQRTIQEKKKFGEDYESIDGGNRKRAIKDFCNNKFATNAHFNPDIGRKFFKDLTDEEKNRFYNFKIRFVIYEKLSPKLKAIVWETTNNSTPVNHQEMLNGAGDIPIANVIRQLARTDAKLGTNCHPLFVFGTNPQGKIIGEHLTFDPTRLTYDRLVARIATIIHQGEEPCYCDDDNIEDLYADESIDEVKAEIIRKKIIECLNFIFRVAREKRAKRGRNSKLTELEFITLMRLFYTYKARWISYEIKDYEEWFKAFHESYSQFYKKHPSPYGEELIPSYDKNSNELKSRAVLFNDNLGKGDTKRWLDGISWLEENFLTPDELITRGIIVIKDTRRGISKVDREMILAKQKGLCYVDGKPLTLKDAEAAHKKAHTDGGRSDPKNIAMVRACHNRKMGSMLVDEYKKLYLRKKVA